MSDERGSNNASGRSRERSDNRRVSSRSEGVNSEEVSLESNHSENSELENYLIPGYVVEDEPITEDLFANESFARQTANAAGFYTPRPSLGRGFDANVNRSLSPSTHPLPASYSNSPFSPTIVGVSQPPPAGKKSKWLWLLSGRKHAENPAIGASAVSTVPVPGVNPVAGIEPVGVPPVIAAPKIWAQQPYRAIAHISAIAGTLTAAWLLGILVAQIVPGTLKRLPLQESVLRKSSRLASGLWHLPQLWQTPTAETRIEAIPLPETGPILAPVKLPPLERQPLIDELNTVETELLTLDRRVQTLEKRLGKPPYQDADVESRLKALRDAIDPPARVEDTPKYEPTPRDLQAALLAVASRKITLPSDALFAPGDSTIKDSELLNQVLDQLINYPKATVVIRSYSDDQIDAIATRKYTLAQADKLSKYLSQSLPEGYRWVTIGGGQSQPIEPNDSDINRQRNRRIEILVDTR